MRCWERRFVWFPLHVWTKLNSETLFWDKAPGGNATIDTVFNSAEYTRQFLNTCYSRQYYGLPYNTDSNGNIPDSSSPYLGKKDALTDCWSLYFSDATVYQQYYLGSLNANYGTRGNIFPYTREMVWEVVRWCWLLMENIDRVPGMDSTAKKLSWWQKLNA